MNVHSRKQGPGKTAPNNVLVATVNGEGTTGGTIIQCQYSVEQKKCAFFENCGCDNDAML